MCEKRFVVDGICAITCLIIGFVIYCVSRSHILFMDWIGIQGTVPVLESAISKWVVYCLPDALWYMALLLLMDILCQKYKDISGHQTVPIIMMSLAILLPFILEFAQKINLIAGTYDILDIFTYLITFLLILICKRNYFLLALFK